MRRIGAAVLALALAGCGFFGGNLSAADLCRAAADADVRATLGVDADATLAAGFEDGACVWRADGADGIPRRLTAAVRRDSDLRRATPASSGMIFFENELRALEKDHPRTRLLGGLGDVAVIGFGAYGEGLFAGGLVARKDGDVLIMRVEGEDPAAFEETARGIAEEM
jgi:hypothetical protein